MAIKAGQILHAMNQFIIDRIQTGGAGNLNIPQERVYELGNYRSVGIVRDVPDLTFSLDVLDVSTEVEALLCGADPLTAEGDGGGTLGTDGLTGSNYPLATNATVDIISPFKSTQGAFNVVQGVAVPQLTLEQAQYRYGLRQNAGENFTLRGDSIYYIPGAPYLIKAVGDGTTTTYTYTVNATPLTALLYTEQGHALYALNVSVNGVRMTRGTDYDADASGVTFTVAPATGAKIRIVFGSITAGVTYSQSVHATQSVKPAAIRGKDIEVYVGTAGATPAAYRWSDVQSVQVDWRVNLENDFEFGNPHAVARDFVDAPDVTGTIEMKPITIAELFKKLHQMTGVPATDIVGPQSSVTLPLQVRLLNPDTGGTSAYPVGTCLKTLHVPDARFEIPGYEGRVGQKMVSQIRWQSDSGVLNVFRGLPYHIADGEEFGKAV
jgi:hypothetical protein